MDTLKWNLILASSGQIRMHGPEAANIMRTDMNFTGTILGVYSVDYNMMFYLSSRELSVDSCVRQL